MQYTNLQFNNSLWEHYKPDFIDPMYKPYNPKKHQHSNSSMDNPLLHRKNMGLTFEKQFPQWPCPMGWEQDPQRPSFCVKKQYRKGSFYEQDTVDTYLRQTDPRPAYFFDVDSSLNNASYNLSLGNRVEYIRSKGSVRGISKKVIGDRW